MSHMFFEKSVMIVDDSAIVQQAFKRLFEAIGMKVVGIFSDAAQAIEKLDELNPDLVSLDILMPHFHGIEGYRKMRQRRPNQDIIFMSCIASDPAVKESFRGEIDEKVFHSKPTSVEELVDILQRYYKVAIPVLIDKSAEAVLTDAAAQQKEINEDLIA